MPTGERRLSMSYEEEVLTAIDTLIDLCAYHNGTDCGNCLAYTLCTSSKPLDLLTQQEANK